MKRRGDQDSNYDWIVNAVGARKADEDLGEDWLAQNAKWMGAAELLKTLRALESALTDSEDDEELLEEIQYAVGRYAEAEKHNTRVRLVMVM